jgi:hypothetical protein
MPRTILIAGVSTTNQTLYHRIRFLAGDSAAFIEFADVARLARFRNV